MFKASGTMNIDVRQRHWSVCLTAKVVTRANMLQVRHLGECNLA